MTNTTLDAQASQNVPRLAMRLLATVGIAMRYLARMSAGAQAARYAGELAELTDEQLAARGLTRDGIVAHAFRHLTWR